MHHVLIALVLARAVAPAAATAPTVGLRLMQQRVKARWLAERSPKAKAWWPQ